MAKITCLGYKLIFRKNNIDEFQKVRKNYMSFINSPVYSQNLLVCTMKEFLRRTSFFVLGRKLVLRTESSKLKLDKYRIEIRYVFLTQKKINH